METIVKKGWLTKKGKKRFFVLTIDGALYYFSKEQDKLTPEAKKKVKGLLQLTPKCTIDIGISDKNKKRFEFTIIGSDNKQSDEYTLVAQSSEERQEWINILNASISKTATPSASPRNSMPIQNSNTPLSENRNSQNFGRQGFLVNDKGRKHFYKLKKDHLLWFVSEKEDKLAGSLSLVGSSVDTSGECIIITSGDTTLELTAASLDLAKQWVSSLKSTISFLQQTPLSTYREEKEWGIRVEGIYENQQVSRLFLGTHTAETIKAELVTAFSQVNTGQAQSLRDIFSPDVFLLRVPEINYYLLEETVPLYQIPLFIYCRKAFIHPKLELIQKFKLIDEGTSIPKLLKLNPEIFNKDLEEKQQSEIEYILGEKFSNMLASKSAVNGEVHCFRRELAKFRLNAFDQIKDRLPQYLQSEPLPQTIPEKVTVVCNLPGDKHKSLSLDVNSTVASIKATIFDKLMKIDLNQQNKSIENYLLKVTGYRSYFTDENQKLIDFDYVRSRINQDEVIHLSLVELDESQIWLKKEQKPIVDKILALESETDLLTDDEIQQRQDIAKSAVSISQVSSLFRIRINSCKNIVFDAKEFGILEGITTLRTFVSVGIYHGGTEMDASLDTKSVEYQHSTIPASQENNQVFWNQSIAFTLPLNRIPKAARLCLTLYAKPTNEEESKPSRPIGWVNFQIFDHKSHLSSGIKILKLWRGGKANPIGTCVDNISDPNPILLTIEFEKLEKRHIIFQEIPVPQNIEIRTRATTAQTEQIQRALDILVTKDSLQPLSKRDLELIWEYRHLLTGKSQALSKFLKSVDWTNVDCVKEAYYLLKKWAEPTPVQALELLDANFSDARVREYALRILDKKLSDADLNDFLLQLTQVLKYEPYHDSALARFLISRALNNKDLIGHNLFWHLKAELHVPEIFERYSLLLETYLRGCGSVYRSDIYKQCHVVTQLVKVAQKVQEYKDEKKEERLEQCWFLLRQVDFPKRFTLPLFNDRESKGLIIEKCKVMTSKKMPLWLVFENADRNGEPITIIFKCGDDLRQDVLTLRVIKIMDKLWKLGGYNLHMKPYGVVATGDETGMVEVVLDSETTANINREAGGIRAILEKNVLAKWLRTHNPDSAYENAVKTFALSCAGYCVATYVIGIGDRHNDNIMLHKQGNLFHIDFGHFLGHFKTKFGYKREKAPFVFTPQYAFILGNKGSEMYTYFENVCCAVYNIIRRHSTLFINLFSMMLSVGLPELQSVDDIMFLRDKLSLDKSDEAAASDFVKLIEESLNTKATQFMEMVHIWATNK